MVLNKKDIIPIFSKDSSNINKILNLGVYESTIVSTDEYGRREIFEVNGITTPNVIKILSKEHISLLKLNIGDTLRLDLAIQKLKKRKKMSNQ